ncbi:hypothetical protein [Erwinia mallotivora]|uniref:Uncharacterized protein n=1 Tax=Erwinia mallotivora TaxID=69222 RepID=A0A014MFA6_9GAMM|nr:hypothetical protein [Erwinia mallotivora]EXU76759.1 hypothetical protein BG55_03805 [Erwinia mallotivora]
MKPFNSKPSVVYGYHGLDKEVAYDILNNNSEFLLSDNSYDWLSGGVYFWENNYERAMDYAIESSSRKDSKIKTPFVLGAVIDLGTCLDLLDHSDIEFVKEVYELFVEYSAATNAPLPVNSSFNLKVNDLMKRELDCAVLSHAKELASQNGITIDTVRAAFQEGNPIYPTANFYDKTHIQIAVINPKCIKGIYLPREI